MLIATDVWIFYIFKYISNSKLLLFSLSSKETHNIVHNYVVINKNHVQKIQKSKKYEQRKTLEHILEFAIEDHKFVVSQLQKCFYQFKNKPQQFLTLGAFCKSHLHITKWKIHDLYIHNNEIWMYGCITTGDNCKINIVLFIEDNANPESHNMKYDVRIAWYSLPYFDSFHDTRQHFHCMSTSNCSRETLKLWEIMGICFDYLCYYKFQKKLSVRWVITQVQQE